MKTNLLASFALTLAFVAPAPWAEASEGHKAGLAVLTPTGAIKWSDVPDFPGVKLAVLHGDPAKGPCHLMIKFADGFASPLHHHTSDHFVTVVSGTLSLTVDGKEILLPPGSFFLFKGRKEHLTKCVPGAECVLALDVRGKWDVVPEKSESMAKK